MNGTDQHDALVDDYLRRLEEAAYALSPQRRAELVLEIRDHIADARTSATGPTDEAWTRTLLDRLGTPEEIVAAATEGDPPPVWLDPAQPQVVQRPAGTPLELAAVLLLTVGSIVPIVGWLAGVVCLWGSKRWRTWEKLLGTLVVPGGPFIVLWFALAVPAQTCSSGGSSSAGGVVTTTPETCTGFALNPAFGVPAFLFVLIAPIVVAGWLYARARARAALEPPTYVAVGPRRRIQDSPWGSVELAAVLLLSAGPFLLPVLGPIIGLALVWSSQSWTTEEKGIGTAIALSGLVVPLAFGFLFAL
jgi:hypothetical protein